MNSKQFDTYRTGSSFIHRADPRIKLILSLLLIISNLLLPDGAWIIFYLVLLLIIFISYFAEINWLIVLKRSLIIFPFLLAAVTVMMTIPGTPLFEFKLFTFNIILTDAGMIRFASILLRSWLSIQVVILLVITTEFPDIAHSLRHLKFPSILIASAEYREPHRLAIYVHELAGMFHKYYAKFKVIDETNVELSFSRLYLISAVKNVIAISLDLMGISAPEKM